LLFLRLQSHYKVCNFIKEFFWSPIKFRLIRVLNWNLMTLLTFGWKEVFNQLFRIITTLTYHTILRWQIGSQFTSLNFCEVFKKIVPFSSQFRQHFESNFFANFFMTKNYKHKLQVQENCENPSTLFEKSYSLGVGKIDI